MKALPLLILTQFVTFSLMCPTHAQSSPNQSSTSSTAANKGDDKSNSVTPFNQSNADEDLKVTQNIRQAIENQSGLSQDAKNIKIITTTDHTVYLKGVVDSKEERDRIVALAKPIIGGRSFKNFLILPSETHSSTTQQ